MGTVIILIGSKASFVSLIILGAFWVFKSPLKPLVKLIFASVVVVLLVIYIKHDYNSALGRLVIWKITILNSLDNVISGNGLASFYLNYPTYQGEYFRSYTGEIHEKLVADEVEVAFNEFIQFYNELGLLLAIFLIILIVYHLRLKVSKNARYWKYVVVVISATSLFSYPLHSTPLLLLFFLSLGIINYSAVEGKVYRLRVYRNIYMVSIVVCLVTLFAYLSNCYFAIQLRQEWLKANSISLDDKELALRYYTSLYPNLKTNGKFLYAYGQSLVDNNDDERAIEILVEASQAYNRYDLYLTLGHFYSAKGHYFEAIKFYEKAYFMIPNRFIPKYYLFVCWSNLGQTDKARFFAKEILSFPVKVQSPIVRRIKNEVRDYFERKVDKSRGTH